MTNRTMTAALALALGLLAGLGCKDDHCDVTFDWNDSEEEQADDMCAAVALIEDCLVNKWGAIDRVPGFEGHDPTMPQTDDEFTAEVVLCIDEFEFCDDNDPNALSVLDYVATTELLGDTNDCVG